MMPPFLVFFTNFLCCSIGVNYVPSYEQIAARCACSPLLASFTLGHALAMYAARDVLMRSTRVRNVVPRRFMAI